MYQFPFRWASSGRLLDLPESLSTVGELQVRKSDAGTPQFRGISQTPARIPGPVQVTLGWSSRLLTIVFQLGLLRLVHSSLAMAATCLEALDCSCIPPPQKEKRHVNLGSPLEFKALARVMSASDCSIGVEITPETWTWSPGGSLVLPKKGYHSSHSHSTWPRGTWNIRLLLTGPRACQVPWWEEGRFKRRHPCVCPGAGMQALATAS